jgi:HPt (histidine-containing phosphotransfer) domain-containing protein
LNVGLEQSTISEPTYTSGTSFEAHVEIPSADTFTQPSDIQSPTSTVQTANYIPDVEGGSQTLMDSEQVVQYVEESPQLLAELEQMRDQRIEAISILNHFMKEICDHLRSHAQKSLAEQLEQELRTYLISPDIVSICFWY